jgi:hypothetical protein
MRLLRSNALVACVVRILGTFFLPLATVAAAAQVVSPGSVVLHPEEITGIWETGWPSSADTVLSSHGVLGLSVALITTVPGTTKTFSGTEQKIQLIRIVTYLRHGDHSDSTVWWTGALGNLDWRDNHLRLHAVGSRNGPEPVDLDLVFDPAESRWSGSFKSPTFSGNVSLRRPLRGEPTAPTGTWKWSPNASGQSHCIHIGLGVDGRLVIWEDVLTLNGLSQYANHLHAPERTGESYGELSDDPMEQRLASGWRFRVGNGLGGDTFTGEVSDGGLTFSGGSKHFGNGIYGPNGPPTPFIWHRVEGDSCTAPPSPAAASQTPSKYPAL